MAKRDAGFRALCCLFAGLSWLTVGCTAQVQAEARAAGDAEPEPEADAPTELVDATPRETEGKGGDQKPLLVDHGPPGTITVIYKSRQITGCAVQDQDGEKVCSAKSDKEFPRKADVALLPVGSDGEEDATRAEVVLSFDESQPEQKREVELAAGRWELEWQGESTARDTFKVVSRDRFEITLEGIAGMCTQEGKACKLEPQKNQQVIELPEARGVR